MEYEFDAKNKKKNIQTFLNPYSYLVLRKQGMVDRVYDNFYVGYDGFSMIILLKMLGVDKQRSSFDDTSIAPKIFSLASKQKLSVALIGSKTETIESVRSLIQSKYKISVSFCTDGYFDEAAYAHVLEQAALCSLVVTSLGTPKQEKLLLDLQSKGWSGLGFTCGGYFDQLVCAKGQKYYPEWIDKLNLRWAYRIYQEPQRLLGRYLIDYPIGAVFFIFDAVIGGKIKKIKQNQNIPVHSDKF